MMSRITWVIIQISLHQYKNREEVNNRENKEFWIITLIILLIIYILGKSKLLITLALLKGFKKEPLRGIDYRRHNARLLSQFHRVDYASYPEIEAPADNE